MFPVPVELEPPFKPFPGYRVQFVRARANSGTKSTLLSRLASKEFNALPPPPARAELVVPQADVDDDPTPDFYGLREMKVSFPANDAVSAEQMGRFLTTLSMASGLVGLRIIGDAEAVMAQLNAQFPEAEITWSRDSQGETWGSQEDGEPLVLEFGLYQDFMHPLADEGLNEPYVSLIDGMAKLSAGETSVYQVFFTPLRAPWRAQMLTVVTKADGNRVSNPSRCSAD